MSKKIGGFRLRYGRCYNTGFATIGIHPAVSVLLNDAFVVGTGDRIADPDEPVQQPPQHKTGLIQSAVHVCLVKLLDGLLKRLSLDDFRDRSARGPMFFFVAQR